MCSQGWQLAASCLNCRKWGDVMDILDITPLPILLFDERRLTPSFGYVFNPKWLNLHESIVSILWKLVRMNRLSGHMVATQIASARDVDPYEGIAACLAEMDICQLNRVLRAAFIPDTLQDITSPYFRFCRICMGRGYHGVMHQFETIKTCPVHHILMEIHCGSCKAQTPYRLNAQLLDAPYRCSFCRKPYGSCSPAISENRLFGKKARIANTRSRLHSCSPAISENRLFGKKARIANTRSRLHQCSYF